MAFERAVCALIREFVNPESAFNFLSETELSAFLFGAVRSDAAASRIIRDICRDFDCRREVCRLEWKSHGSEFDVVLIYPDAANLAKARNCWSSNRLTPKESVRLLAAAMLKRGGGKLVPINRGQSIKADQEKLQRLTGLKPPSLVYMLVYVDHQPGKNSSSVARRLKLLRSWCDEDSGHRRGLFATKDFAVSFPENGWLLSPDCSFPKSTGNPRRTQGM